MDVSKKKSAKIPDFAPLPSSPIYSHLRCLEGPHLGAASMAGPDVGLGLRSLRRLAAGGPAAAAGATGRLQSGGARRCQ